MGHTDEQLATELPSCPACGARAHRASARYCATCGRGLRERDYSPADLLRASYRWPAVTPPRAHRAHAPVVPSWRRRNEWTARGYVFLAYALVPVVGVVFCACAVVCCAAGLRETKLAGREAGAVEARRGVAYAVLLAGAHVLLWLFVFTIPVWL
jgi:ribosomal protein L37E/nitrate reductase NapE component